MVIRKGLGKGKGKGFKNIIRSDPIVHQRSAKGQKTFESPLKRQLDFIQKKEIQPLQKDVKQLKSGEVIELPNIKLSKNKQQSKLQRSILSNLYTKKFHKGERLTEPEILTITVQNEPDARLKGQKPADQLEFLSNFTNWKAIGDTRKWGREQNLIIQTEFLDTRSNSLGQDLIKQFQEYNQKYVKQSTLYVRTQKVSETSLPHIAWRARTRKRTNIT